MPIRKLIKSACYLLSLSLLGCAELAPSPAKPALKNVILIIGDGMGPQQVGLLLSYARQAPNGTLKNQQTALDRLLENGTLGMSMTYAADSLVTDSAASATQLATGKFAAPEMLGLDKHGIKQQNTVEFAKSLGKATGLVSDTRITHATPAGFAAHQNHRSEEDDIAEDLLAADPDVMLSGGLGYWLPKQSNDASSPLHEQVAQLIGHSFPAQALRHDDKNLLYAAQQKNYSLAFNKTQLQNARGKVLGLFANSGMSNGLIENQNKTNPKRTEPTLKEMAEKALEILDRHDKGFFLMIESGQIDWAGHHNDAGLLLHEMLRFNDMLHVVLDWAKNRDDTLIMVTADHETGGFGFSYSNNNIPPARKLADGTLFKPHANFGDPIILDKLYAQQRSYHDIFSEFNTQPKTQQTPSTLSKLVNRYTAFNLTEEQAATILKTKANPAYQANAKPSEKNSKEIPVMPINEAFFTYGMENRENLLAQALSNQQNAVWASGAHTSTPVYVFAAGPKPITEQFSKIWHHTELGKTLLEALRCSDTDKICNIKVTETDNQPVLSDCNTNTPFNPLLEPMQQVPPL